MTAYRVLDEQYMNVNVIEITEGENQGRKFIIGEVALDNEKEGVLSYDLTVLNSEGADAPNEISDSMKEDANSVVIDLLEKMLENREVIYHGGV